MGRPAINILVRWISTSLLYALGLLIFILSACVVVALTSVDPLVTMFASGVATGAVGFVAAAWGAACVLGVVLGWRDRR